MTQDDVLEETSKAAKRSRSITEGRLLRAGLEVFSEMGFDAATTRMIAHRAETNEALIHRYFQSKKGLFDAIVLKFMQQAEEACEYPMGGTAEDEIRNFLQQKLQRITESRDFLRIIMTRASLDPELNTRLRTQLPMGGASVLASRLRILQQKGQIDRTIDVNETAFNINFASCAMIYMGQLLMGIEINSAINEFAKAYGRGLMGSGMKSDRLSGLGSESASVPGTYMSTDLPQTS